MNIEALQYPIGKFDMPDVVDEAQIKAWVEDIDALPNQIKAATEGLTREDLDQPYRPGGWTLRQVIHHLPDSHMNAYIRFKLAITEEVPVIRPYEEQLWAETDEAKYGNIKMSVDLLTSLHHRWVIFLSTLKPEDYRRKYIHPAVGKELTLAYMLGSYAWHGKHHLAHITNAIKNEKG